MKYIFLFFLYSVTIISQIRYEDYFIDGSLRIDYYRTGNNNTEIVSFKEYKKETFYSGSKINLIDNLNLGYHKVKVIDAASENVIFTKNYSSLFLEWQKTSEAKNITKTFEESISIPYPKNKVKVEFYTRNYENKFDKLFSIEVDPNNYFIQPVNNEKFSLDTIYFSNEINKAYDIVFLPEGYTANDSALFKDDCKKYSEFLFKYEPFNQFKNNINIWSVNSYSEESGADVPADSIWKNTSLNSTYYTFDSERYLMTYNFYQVKNIASNAPYDQIVILVNSSKYGGGAIYNFYTTFITRNHADEKVFIHELGHGIAALADEYVDDETYEDYYNLSVEPWEENITTLVDFDSKWKNEVSSETPIPTPSKKEFLNRIGAYEGAGYVPKKIYRPYQNCIMRTLANQNYCTVCEKALRKVLKYYID